MPPPDSPPRRRISPGILIAAGVGLLTALAFLPTLGNGFVNWDDDKNITLNHGFRGLSGAHLEWMFTTFLMGHYQPLAWLTLGVDYVLWGMNPAGYHLTNLLLHALGAVLLYQVLLALLRPDRPWVAAAGALFWAVHPLRVESVAWVTERRDVLCGCFALLSVLAYLRHVREEEDVRWLALSLGAFAAALLSKALAIALPAVLFLMDLYPLGRWRPGLRRRVVLEKLAFLAISAADAGIMLFAMRHIDAVRGAAGYDVVERGAQAAYGLCFYLVKTVWPAKLIPLYRIDSPLHPGDLKYVASMGAVVAVTAGLVALRRRHPGPLVAWGSYIALVSPVLGVVVTGMQIAADRYTYLALIPLSALIAAGLDRIAASKAAGAATVAVTLLLGTLTAVQCGIWKDSVTLWTRLLEVDPGCDLAWNSRGAERLARGDLSGAIEDCSRAATLAPRSPDPLMNRGLALAAQGRLEPARADFDAALERDPKRADVRMNRGIVLSRLGRAEDAMKDFDGAVECAPTLSGPLKNRGLARFERRNLPGAVEDLGGALRFGGPDPEVYYVRGLAFGALGNLPGAAYDFERALASAPRDWPRRPEVEAKLEAARRGPR